MGKMILIVFIVLLFICILLLKNKKGRNAHNQKNGTFFDNRILREEEESLTSEEKARLDDYFTKKYHYYRRKFFIDYQLYYFRQTKLDTKVSESFTNVEIQTIGNGVEDETFFKLASLKSYLQKLIYKYNAEMTINTTAHINEYLKLAEKSVALKAHKEVLEFLRPYIQKDNELEAWERLSESSPEINFY